MAAVQGSDNRQIPTHVPPELVRPIGLTEGPEFLAAPHAFMASLHDTHPPIFFSTSQHAGNAWMLINYEDVTFVLTHPKIFTTKGSTPFPRDPNDYLFFAPSATATVLTREYEHPVRFTGSGSAARRWRSPWPTAASRRSRSPTAA